MTTTARPYVVRNYINGRWEHGATMGQRENPSDVRDIVSEYARADRRQAERAIQAAVDAFPQWGYSTPQRRFDALDRIGGELLARSDELALLLAREEGKTLPEANAEVTRAGQIFKFFAGDALRMEGEWLPSSRAGVQVDVTRGPVGVVGLIAPWNFPFAIAAWKIAPALAYGNTVVFKPAELVPACAGALADIISRASLPAGTFNLVVGSGREVGQTIASSAQVDAVSFTGSQEIGALVLRATSGRGAKVQIEVGGKNSLVVLADADLDRAVECAVQGGYFSTGQRCTASSRFVVENAVFDAFVDRMQRRMIELNVGDAVQRGVDIGPVVDSDRLEQHQRYLAIAQTEGSELICGGELIESEPQGYFMRPALLSAQPEHRVAREEIFGPIACLLRADDYDHALHLTNELHGVCAGICTANQSRAAHFRRHTKVGMTMVNLPTAGPDFHVPFGGRKGAYGPRDQGRYAAEFYSAVRTGYVGA